MSLSRYGLKRHGILSSLVGAHMRFSRYGRLLSGFVLASFAMFGQAQDQQASNTLAGSSIGFTTM
jgi:hypothetical protein